jgi:hypothetical protein
MICTTKKPKNRKEMQEKHYPAIEKKSVSGSGIRSQNGYNTQTLLLSKSLYLSNFKNL